MVGVVLGKAGEFFQNRRDSMDYVETLADDISLIVRWVCQTADSCNDCPISEFGPEQVERSKIINCNCTGKKNTVDVITHALP